MNVGLSDRRLGHLDNCSASRLIPERRRMLSLSSPISSPKLGHQVNPSSPPPQLPRGQPREGASLGVQKKHQKKAT